MGQIAGTYYGTVVQNNRNARLGETNWPSREEGRLLIRSLVAAEYSFSTSMF